MGLYQQGRSVEVNLVEFAPDKDPTTPGILLDMDNAMPTMKGFQTFNSPSPYVTQALTEKPTGSTLSFFSDSTTQVFAGGVNHLWRKFGNTWIQADTLGTTPFGAVKWNFAQFNDDVIAVGGAGIAPQVATGSGGVFVPLGGSPPSGATVVLAVNGQVMMFAGTAWYVSALGTDNNWTPNIQTQSGTATLYDFPGNVVAAAPLYRQVVVFKNQGMWLGQYVGGSAIWSFQPISDLTGTWGQGSVMVLPDSVAFLGTDDFYITTGWTPQRIPNSLKEWFFDTADPTQLANTLSRYDPYHAVGHWYFVSKNAPTAGVPDRYVSYNFRFPRWGTGYLNVTSVPTPNTQTSVTQGLYFDSSYVLQYLSGSPTTARYKTGYYGDASHLSQLMRVRAKYNTFPNTQSLRAYHVNSLGQLDTVGPAGVIGADTWFNLRQYDRYHRVELSVVGSTEPPSSNTQLGAEITSLAFEFREGGIR